MTAPRLETEVCVVGGGPAGSTYAQRLAQLGHRVLVLERSTFPRPHVGEALTPEIWPLLEFLGVRDAVEAAGFLCTTQARVRWVDEEERLVELEAGDPGLTVERSRFDELLLDRAKAAGAAVLEAAIARRPQRTRSGWQVEVSAGSEPVLVDARFVADASGRSSVLGGRREPTSPRTLAIHGSWRLDRAGDVETRVAAAREAWFWAARLPDGSVSAMAFVDPELLHRHAGGKRGLERLYLRLLDEAGLLAGFGDGRLEGAVAACDATCYLDPEPIGEDWIKLGEAAFAIDPLSSAGVRAAIQSALAGSVATHTLLSDGGDAAAALAFYRDAQRHSAEQHRAWAAGFYAQHRLHRDAPFWRRRSAELAEPAQARPQGDLRDLLPDSVRLAPGAALVAVPCAVGDRVELRRALAHPSLERPVAYLAGVELAPLVEGLEQAPTLEEAVLGWAAEMPLERALGVADWLGRHGLLAAAP